MTRNHQPSPERDHIIRMPQVIAQTGLPKSSVLRLVKKLEFPSPLRLSPHTIGFLQSEVDHWIATRPRVESRHEA